MSTRVLRTQCVIAGGGPAGLMAGMLLARAGVDVTVLEKHKDFLRDFRGDTIHPSTMEVMHELGWLEEFLKLPHYPAERLDSHWGARRVEVGNFTRLPTRARFIALMPQWDFLNFIAEKGRSFPHFRLFTECEATGLIEEGGHVRGLRARDTTGAWELRADLVVAADGRGSVLRGDSGLAVENIGAPMDVLWLRLSRKPGDSAAIETRFSEKNLLVLINRGDYWQCAFVIPKGGYEDIRSCGLEAFRELLVQTTGFEAARAAEITTWDQVKLLNVQVNRMPRWWRPGFVCIGDAAHAMSPIGGVGVNLAVQDAVALANLLAQPLREGTLRDTHLAALQARRAFPARMTQRIQVFVQQRLIAAALAGRGYIAPPWPLLLVNRIPVLRNALGRLLGMGVRPEHVRAPAVAPSGSTSVA